MMRYRKTEVVVGSVTLAALVILIGVTVNLKKSTLFSPKDRYRAYFKDAKRLEVGAAVYVHGVVRGEVTKIQATGQKEYPVLVHMTLTKDTALHEGATPRIVTAGFLGETEIDIEDTSPTAPRLDPKDIEARAMYGSTFLDIGDLADRASGVLEDLEVSIRAVSDILNEPRHQEAITRTLESVSSITVRIDRTLDESAGDISGAIHNIRLATANLNDMLSRADTMMTSFGLDLTTAGSELRASIGELRTSAGLVLQRLDDTALRIDAAAAAARSVFATAQSILDDNRTDARMLIEGLTSASVHLGALMTRIEMGEDTVAEILIGSESNKNLRDSIRRLNESLEIVGKWLGGLDRWVTGANTQGPKVNIPYDDTPEKEGRGNQ